MRHFREVSAKVVSLSILFAGLFISSLLNANSGSGQQISAGVIVNPPVPTFAPTLAFGTGGQLAAPIAVADLNGDGKLDVVVGNTVEAGGVGVLLGNGDGTFQPVVLYNDGKYFTAVSIAIADVNGDGKPDIVVANDESEIVIFLGNGDGTFQDPLNFPSGGLSTAIAVADVNGDGVPDLIVANECASSTCLDFGEDPSKISVLLGNGSGTFSPPLTFPTGGYGADSIAVADLNGDGKPDIVVANYCAVASAGCLGTPDEGSVSVLLGNGDGTFQSAVLYDSGGAGSGSVVVGDMNGDGAPDLIVANCASTGGVCRRNNGSIGILLGNGDGTFQAVRTHTSEATWTVSASVADVNGDGNLDVISANYCCSKVVLLLGRGNGTLHNNPDPKLLNSGGLGASSAVAADMNNDGRLDLLVTNGHTTSQNPDGAVGVLLNTTEYSTTTTVSTSTNPSHVNAAVTFSAKVSSSVSIPDGSTVAFYKGSSKLGVGKTTGGVATLTTSFSNAGDYTVKAMFSGGGFLQPSSGSISQMVVKQ
jgi:hypothetical protein